METAAAAGILDGLSPEQRLAVVHGEGPLLIVAGAGTGKTTVLTRRIAHLIATRAARPEEILALTFTEKAAREMRERVDALIPYGYAETVISTFHAFGDRVLRENTFAASLPPDFRVLTRAEEIVFLRERLFDLPLERFRPLGDPGRHIGALVDFASRAKDEGISADEISEWGRAALADAERAAEADAEAGAARRETALDLLEVAGFMKAQARALLDKGHVDFGDQLSLVVALLNRRPDVRSTLRSRFRFILVDEFQDTNHAQLELLRLLADARAPNVTVVGDDDQAIYRWRGAAPANLVAFLKTYEDAARIVLRRNYRSTQVILDAARRLISYNNPWRLESIAGLSKQLEARVSLGPPVRGLTYETVSHEADGVAEAIETARARDGLAWSDVAILVRNNADADPFLRALNMRGIPHRFSGGAGLFHRPEVRALVSYLRLLAAPDDSVPAFALATSDLYDFTPMELTRISRFSHRKTRPLLEVLRDLAAAGETPNETQRELASVSAGTRAAAARLVADTERGSRSMAERRTGEVLYEFLKESGALQKLVARPTAENERRVANIARFFELTRRLGAVLDVDRVPAFVGRFDALRDAGEDPPASDTDFGDASDAEGDAVHVMTVHKAKGLEFPCVFIVGCVDQKFPLRRRADPLPLPSALLKGEVSGGDPHLMEERRLFYVAMTRAKTSLTLTSAADYGAGPSRKVSRFVVEALDLPAPRPRAVRPSPIEIIAASAPADEPALRDAAPTTGAAAPRDDAPSLRLSFRQIDDYATCPLKYAYIHRQRIPLLTHHRVVYGSAVHRAIQALFQARVDGRAFDADDLVAAFRAAWVSEGFLSRAHEDLRLAEGEASLRAFFEAERAAPLRPTGVEEEFSFQVGRTRVQGRYDLVVDAGGGDVTILDFKTGDVDTDSKARARAESSLQLRIYALAMLRTRGRLPSRVELRFVASGLAAGYAPTLDQAQETERIVAATADGVLAGRFEAKPSHHACLSCPFRDICPATAKTGDA